MHRNACAPSRLRKGVARTLCRAVAPLAVLAAGAVLARPITSPQPLEWAFQEPAPTAVLTQRGGVSLEQARQLALQRFPGRVVRAETTVRNGRRVHEIRVLVEGEGDARMRIVRIDAENGRFL